MSPYRALCWWYAFTLSLGGLLLWLAFELAAAGPLTCMTPETIEHNVSLGDVITAEDETRVCMSSMHRTDLIATAEMCFTKCKGGQE